MSHESAPETHSFQAEVARLLHLMVHSVYSEKEVFLRELISNASDACDKLRYEAIANPDLAVGDSRYSITLIPDKTAGTLTITDNGIGMDRGELIDHLGTIARSGTRAFLDRLSQSPEGNALIGQFGVGFYSAFMVADRVTVVSRKAGSAQTWLWSSDGSGAFTVASAEASTNAPARGTSVVLHLKDDAKAYLEPFEIERVVRRYSDHILFPIDLVEAEGKQRQINSGSAIWHRSKSELKPEDYAEAYRTAGGQIGEPAHTIHYKAEGRQSYAVMLFVPGARPLDDFDPSRRGHIKLYVRRVFIADDAELLPPYLRFMRGIVDSEDMPLNLSREMLQNNPLVSQIRRALTSRVLSELEQLASRDADGYGQAWSAFGQVLKEGLYEDFERRDQLLKLARFHSTAGDGWRSLTDYVSAMRPNQTEIYYLTGDSLDRIRTSPQIEAARVRGVEVLLLHDPVDAFWTTMVQGYDGKPFRSLSQGDVDLSLIAPERSEEPASDTPVETGLLIAALKKQLSGHVSDVRPSKRLVESPACLVAAGQGPDRTLDRLLQRQERGSGVKPVLEINSGHALVKAAAARASSVDGDIADVALVLLGQAHVLDGELPPDPAQFAASINRLVLNGLAT